MALPTLLKTKQKSAILPVVTCIRSNYCQSDVSNSKTQRVFETELKNREFETENGSMD